jgi:drug/metabolite transporter (DMT)-like permease
MGFAMLTLSGAVILVVGGGATMPGLPALALITGATVFGVAAYAALTAAMRSGDVATVTPFRYTRLLFALVLGVMVFGERPDAMTLLGSAIIVVCGVLILTQGRRIA